MGFPGVPRAATAAATLALLAACAGPGPSGPAEDPACAPYAAYHGQAGSTITVSSSIRGVEADKLVQAWAGFETCTGITIDYTGRADFEKSLPVEVAAGHVPDVALFPQPGLLALVARAGRLQPAPAAVADNVRRYFPADWQRYGTVDGELYGTPIDGNVKSLVWYSPKFFAAHGWTVPQTWAELIGLSDRIAGTGTKPWCAGIESGGSTGWPVTDWLEDVLLRTAGPAVYDEWVEHRIPFDDPRVVAALDRVGGILRNPRYVNGGLGGVASIATTAYQEAGLPILTHDCALHHQASFYTSFWPANADIAPDGDLYAFYLPPVDPAAGRPVLGAGVFAAAFTDRPEVQAFSLYLTTPDFADSRARTSGIVSSNKGLDRDVLTTPIGKLSAALLADPEAAFRFDGSDQMPAAVGAGTFWSGMTDWIRGADTATVLHRIETTWPA
ncbi:ABC transporter substrate-binding protein [Dactylosporangium matsuzakiense]|uniref:Alpha-glucoside ABC transporter substrate-binding protein n=1 Tax=Dactylosporangium matsuzakiense TaxID=53360 RepID=A0A9W6KDX4_9ACTN|nr:extracellular solute-binding protein [Dactylosporangium matsuzakiense]UWZ42095.1 extracellular solute-binding protein [Dactylosporangium matsuzakiense]GLK99722.1 alpha-glucoside ABC transporter substrate-binding protein [Dactylosporangium matsuzakiense]